jgi:hypothetical protein
LMEDGPARHLGHELIAFGNARMTGIFKPDHEPPVLTFDYDVLAFSEAPEASAAPNHYRLPEPATYRFIHTNDQARTVAHYLGIYGTSLAGLSRILAKVYVRKLFRQPMKLDGTAAELANRRDMRFGQAALTGLSQFS